MRGRRRGTARSPCRPPATSPAPSVRLPPWSIGTRIGSPAPRRCGDAPSRTRPPPPPIEHVGAHEEQDDVRRSNLLRLARGEETCSPGRSFSRCHTFSHFAPASCRSSFGSTPGIFMARSEVRQSRTRARTPDRPDSNAASTIFTAACPFAGRQPARATEPVRPAAGVAQFLAGVGVDRDHQRGERAVSVLAPSLDALPVRDQRRVRPFPEEGLRDTRRTHRTSRAARSRSPRRSRETGRPQRRCSRSPAWRPRIARRARRRHRSRQDGAAQPGSQRARSEGPLPRAPMRDGDPSSGGSAPRRNRQAHPCRRASRTVEENIIRAPSG